MVPSASSQDPSERHLNMSDKTRVLMLCTGNSARSQMAEGLLRHDHGERFEVESAGTKPGSVRPEAIAVMREVGIDITGHRSKHVEEFGAQQFDYVDFRNRARLKQPFPAVRRFARRRKDSR